MITAAPVERDLVLVGGGHSHVAVLRALGMRPAPGLRCTLITPVFETPYSGMLPGLLAGHYTHAEAHVDLAPLARFAGARLLHTAATGLDLDARAVLCRDRPPVPFDLLSLDIGSTPRSDQIDGAAEHAFAVKPVERFLERVGEIEARMRAQSGRIALVVIGAGAGGVELSLSVHHRLSRLAREAGLTTEGIRIAILSGGPEPLPGHGDGVRARLRAALARRGIVLHERTSAVAVEPGRVHRDPGAPIDCDAAILVTTASPAPWLEGTGLALDDAGFVRVRDTLESVSHRGVFAAGDVAAVEGHALPKSGVYAVREGPVLARNLRGAAQGIPLAPYRPQSRTLALISTGDANAVASWGDLAVEGRWLWTVKDWIDRRWMRRYQVLPEMAGGDAAGDGAMRCAGCGSKVASSLLERVLARLDPGSAPGVESGTGRDADDAALIAPPPGKLLVQSVDHFRAFVDDPRVFGRITAVHCLSDLHAMGAVPHSAQAVVTLPYASEAKQEQDLEALLSGTMEVLREESVALIGGHTAEGPEMAFGLAVNGFAGRGQVLHKGGLRAGDALILTKALGTGVVLAADMRAKAPGASLGAALDAMQRSNGPAARVLTAHGAAGCTDVTGFGLLGHLLEMLRAGRLSASVDAGSLPALPGALDLIRAGFASTLAPANAAFLAAVDDASGASWLHGLICDPQTAGGLLAGIAPERADPCLEALRSAGCASAAVIGRVDGAAGPGGPVVRLR